MAIDEKIFKLLESKNTDDNLIGIKLFLAKTNPVKTLTDPEIKELYYKPLRPHNLLFGLDEDAKNKVNQYNEYVKGVRRLFNTKF